MAITSMTFDETYYLNNNADVLTYIAKNNLGSGWASTHFSNYGWKESRDPNANFDTSYYLAKYTDVLAANVNPFTHFQTYGTTENRAPTSSMETAASSFDETTYKTTYTDVAAAITAGTLKSAYQHWIMYGQYEARAAQTTTGTSLSGQSSTATSGVTLTLTQNADVVGTAASIGTALRTTDYNDTINAYAASGTAGTLSNGDLIAGGGGTDTLAVTLDKVTAGVAPTLSAIENVSLRIVNASGYFSFANSTGVTAIEIYGTTDVGATGVITVNNSANITLTGDYSRTARFALANDLSASDTVTFTIANGNSADLFYGSAGGNFTATGVGFEVVNLVAKTAFQNGVFSFGNASALNISGTGAVTLQLSNLSANFGMFTAQTAMTATAVESFQVINASALQGSLNLVLNTAGLDQTIVGGIGNDNFYVSAQFNQSDSLDGGAGTDLLSWAVAASGTFRPGIQGIETMTVDFNADAVIDLRNASASNITTLNVLAEASGSAAVFSALASATKTINIYSGSTAGSLTINYASAASDVTVNLSNQATATSTGAWGMSAVTFAANTGKLTIAANHTSTAGGSIDSLVANDVTELVIDINCGNFLIGTAGGAIGLAASGAKAVTLNIHSHGFALSGSALARTATAFSINVDGATGAGNFDDIILGSAANLKISMGSQATALTIGTASFITTGGANTASLVAGFTFVNSGVGDFTVSAMNFDVNSSSALSFAMTVSQTASGAFSLQALNFTLADNDTGTATFDITLDGIGSYDLSGLGSAGGIGSAQVVIIATAMKSASTFSADFTTVLDASLKFDVRLGAATGTGVLALGIGADKVAYGLSNEQWVRGFDGADELTMNNTAISIALYNLAGTGSYDSGNDTIFGIGSGDMIIFEGSAAGVTATSTGITGGWLGTATMLTGTGWVLGTAQSVTAHVKTATLGGTTQTAGDQLYFMAVYTAAGDMVIEVTTKTASAMINTAADDTLTLRLNGKGDVLATALMRIDMNGSGGVVLTML